MGDLMSRKEVCEELNISMRTLCRKIEELNIESVNEILPNNVISKKIKYEDFLRIAESCQKSIDTKQRPMTSNSTNSNTELVLYGLKTELIKAQVNLEHSQRSIIEKDETIRKLEEKNERLFNEFLDLNKKYNESLNKKGFWWRLFGH